MKTASKTFPVMSTATDPDHRPDLHGLLRHVHGGRRIRGHRRRADQLRSSERFGRVAASSLQLAARHGAAGAESVGDLVELTELGSPPSCGDQSVLVPGPAGTTASDSILGQQSPGERTLPGEPTPLGAPTLLGAPTPPGAPTLPGAPTRKESSKRFKQSRCRRQQSQSARRLCSQDPSVRTHRSGRRDAARGPWRTGIAAIRSAWYLSRVAAALGSVLKLQLPGVRGMVSVSALFVLIGIVNLSLSGGAPGGSAVHAGAVHLAHHGAAQTAADCVQRQRAFRSRL